MLLRAYAKVNFGLSVLRKRKDGFHDIDTIFVLIDLFDLIGLEPNQSGINLTVKNANLATDRNNLAYKAAELYLEAADEKRGVDIVLEKNIPIAAGLGGGSSDAAAVLRAMKILYPTDIDIWEIGKELGSDIPFFLSGYSAAYGSSRGEILIKLAIDKVSLILVNPRVEVSAKDAYQGLSGFASELDVAKILRQLKLGEKPDYFNSLESSVCKFEPRVKEAIELLKSFPKLYGVLMSGSGASCFALAENDLELERARARIEQLQPDYWLHICHSL